jgi:hypothetical protein
MALYMRIFGKEEELAATMQALRDNGFTFTPGERIELSKSPCNETTPFAYQLHDFCPPAVPTPQPRPWDAVLGGKN